MSKLITNTIRHTGASSDSLTFNSDGHATVENNLTVDGTSTLTGNVTASGTLTASNFSGRNKVINGQFNVWQRATTSGSVTASGYNSADRWYINQSGATSTTSRQAFTVGQTDVPSNPRYYLRMNATTANNNAGIEQRVEDVDTVQGEHTLSFWVKGTAPAGGNFDVRIFQNFGSGGSTATEANLGTCSVSGSWVKKTFTFTPTSLSGKTVGTSSYFQISIRQPDSDGTTTAWTLDIANVQLEVGDTATEFEHRSYGDDLARCQRYYYRHVDDNTDAIGVGGWYTASMFTTHVGFPTTMRSAPTLEKTSGTNYYRVWSSGTNQDGDDVAMERNSITGCVLDFSTNFSGTAGAGGNVNTSNAAAKISFNAEL